VVLYEVLLVYLNGMLFMDCLDICPFAMSSSLKQLAILVSVFLYDFDKGSLSLELIIKSNKSIELSGLVNE
jgi:hypothetical protein